MTDLAGMLSYFWLTSSRLREPIRDEVPYTTQALRQDLLRVRNAWDECQAHRERDAIYGYLTAVFDLVMWWKAEDRAISRARWALQLQHLDLPSTGEPFAAVIAAPPIPARWTSERDPSGRACSVTVPNTNRIVNRLPRSFAAKAASTNVLRDLPGASGDGGSRHHGEHPVLSGSRAVAQVRMLNCKAIKCLHHEKSAAVITQISMYLCRIW
jgi:hypothetical protein